MTIPVIIGRQDRQFALTKDLSNETRMDLLGVDGVAGTNLRGRCALAGKAREVIYWCFAGVTKVKVGIGVSDVEKEVAGAGEDA